MASSIVGSNSRRKLRVDEFRGFVLVDKLAPLVFLNAADSKAAQMFTLAHELAHIWLGESGISDSIAGDIPDQAIERWCNSVAAELLVPISDLRREYNELEALNRIRSLDSRGGGGNFYRALGARIGKRFARAVLSSTLEGQTLFQDAFRLLGVRKTSTFYKAAHEMEVML